MQFELAEFATTLEVPDEVWIKPVRAQVVPNVVDLQATLYAALEEPQGFPALRRAITPDDRLAIVVDDRVPHAGLLVSGVIEYLTDTGISPASITLLSAAGSRQAWVDTLPDKFQDVLTEIHDPSARKNLSYLATTRQGRRVYLNRTLVDADQTVVLSCARYDGLFGRSVGGSALFPAFSDLPTINEAGSPSQKAPDEVDWPWSAEADEVAWLLGVPFMLQIVEGAGDGIAHIIGGTVESAPEARRLLDARWQVEIPALAQTVLLTLTGDPQRQEFSAIAQAALVGARVVEPGGRIVILSKAAPELGDGARLMREMENPALATRLVREQKPSDQTAALQWLEAARRASLYLLSNLPEETVEEMFATPLQHSRQAQRLIVGSVLVLPDGHRSLAVIST